MTFYIALQNLIPLMEGPTISTEMKGLAKHMIAYKRNWKKDKLMGQKTKLAAHHLLPISAILCLLPVNRMNKVFLKNV